MLLALGLNCVLLVSHSAVNIINSVTFYCLISFRELLEQEL